METAEPTAPAESPEPAAAEVGDPFTAADREQLRRAGIVPAEALRQLALLRRPPSPSHVFRPCRLGDGIHAIAAGDEPRLLALADAAAGAGRASKFVPASGAASRMFKDLVEDLEHPTETPAPAVAAFLQGLPRFAFYEELAAALARGGRDLEALLAAGDRAAILAALLGSEGLDYDDRPKGLVPFHRYADGPRTAFEEHLVEAARTVADRQGVCRLHVTVAPQFEADFRTLLERARGRFEPRLGVRFAVDFSSQHPSTDTLAADPAGRPFRQDDGTLLLRPGGHGALIENLAEMGASYGDLVLVENIDNVVPDAGKPLVARWRRLLLGYLVELAARIAASLEDLESGEDGGAIGRASHLLATALGRPLPPAFADAPLAAQRAALAERLSRPLRVCGVVRNTGEPGGGPFWIRGAGGEISVQIVESSQIDQGNAEQRAHWQDATHFNPVDLACALRDRRGRPFDLHRYVDPATVFLSAKSYGGRSLRALERPGLWNGAMAGWNTAFVEVPNETFAPVKTVLDLLRPEHQGA